MATRVEGLDRLRKKLNAIPEISRQEIRKALEKSAEEIVALAKSLVPVATGELRDSIGWTWGDAPSGSMVLAEASGPDDLKITVFAGNSEAFYARWVEFGTTKMQHQPFFYPAYRALRKRVRGRITRATRKAARIAAGKA